MNRRGFLAASSALAMAPLLVISGCAIKGGSASAGQNQQRHRLRYGFTLENPGGSPLVNQMLWFYAPIRKTSAQRLAKLTVSVPVTERSDAYGNTFIQVAVPALAPYSTQLVNVEAELEMQDVPAVVALERRAEFTSAEAFIESDDPALVALARQLATDHSLKTARAVYDWVKSEVRYAGFIADDLGARRAFKERRGDCTEYAYLVCALARANGIPARAVGGYMVRQNTLLQAGDYHNWAELYIDNKWQVVDAQKQQFMPAQNNYVAFEIIASRNINSLKGAHRYRVEGEMRVSMS